MNDSSATDAQARSERIRSKAAQAAISLISALRSDDDHIAEWIDCAQRNLNQAQTDLDS